MTDEGLPQRAKQSSRPFGSLRPDSKLYPVGVDNPFNALDFRQPSIILNPQAGCLASTFCERNEKENTSATKWVRPRADAVFTTVFS